MTQKPTVKCPTCQRNVIWEPAEQYRPFCSERCRMIDLGLWANESYSVPLATDTNPNEFNAD
ncbi:MAG: DNA gyrase inhibitor YacG [Betaproteobacteria bacterium]|nr:DNA gyrase inhibitor YacG [Betaproteobacteria bacterium]